MSDFMVDFHFLRPGWLWLLIPAIFIWWRVLRGHDPRLGLTDDIAPHLLDELVTSPTDRSNFRPATLLLPIWVVAIIAVAGPSFRRQPSPFAEDKAQLLLVVKMTPSMETADLQPSRLERSRTKVHDLLELRKGAGTALITYSGSAHLVMPATSDDSVIDHMLESLSPSIMPVDGDALSDALEVATQLLTKKPVPGSILVIADSVQASHITQLAKWRERETTGVQFLAALPSDAALAQSGIPAAAETLGASVRRITPDPKDIEAIASRADRAIVAAAASDSSHWHDDGYFLVPLVAMGLLVWCRRGWSVQS